VGTRVRVLGEDGPETDVTYYVEGVAHNWSLAQGTRTTLSVTRGWKGTDDSLKAAIDKSRSRYVAVDGDTSNPDKRRKSTFKELSSG
jgi:hypothetical protein